MIKKRTICPLDCPDACSIIASVENDCIVDIKGDPSHPFTQGFLCRKVSTYHHRVQSDDRILWPQRRVGKKGDGQFERISWNEAWELLVNKLRQAGEQFGCESVLPYSYAGNMGIVARTAGDAFFYQFGASRLKRTICSTAANAGWNMHYGGHPASPPEKALDADLIVAWGINIKVSNIHFMPFVQKARKRGARFVVIDPYRNTTARTADNYYAIRPGGDTALALAIAKIHLQEQYLDTEFIEHYGEGFADWADYLRRQSLDELASQSGLELTAINELSALLAAHTRSFIRIGIGLTRNTQGAMSVRAITCLAAARGLFDGKPGRGCLLSSQAFSGDTEKVSFHSLMKHPTRAINMVQLGNALLSADPPIKAMLVYSSNPLSVAPDSAKVRRGLEREDLFTMVHEQVMTPTARYADLLLPATTSFESPDFFTGYGHFQAMRTEAVIQPRGEAISNFDLFQILAQKMGFDAKPFQQNIETRIDSYLDTLKGIDTDKKDFSVQAGDLLQSTLFDNGGDYTAFEGARFKFSTADRNDNTPHFPCLLPRREFDDKNLARLYPFSVITPPTIEILNSTFGERYPGETGDVWIHPNDAEAQGITDGQPVKIFNHRGEHQRKACVTTNTQPGLLVLPGVYWESNETGHTGINDLTSQETTDLGEGGTFHESRAAIRAV